MLEMFLTFSILFNTRVVLHNFNISNVVNVID